MFDDDLQNMVDENDVSLDNIKESGLDDFLSDINSDVVEQKATIPTNTVVPESEEVVAEPQEEQLQEEEPEEITEVAKLSSAPKDDFANLQLSDFDAALNSYKAARAGKPVGMQINPEQQSANTQNTGAVASTIGSDNKPQLMQASTVDDADVEEYDAERKQEIMNWYSGSLKEKTYKISADNMPEFLDSDKTIRVIHVDVRSPYGWNVFFDNGVFMSLRDLKEYQERHGEMPCQDGKIIYGSKSCTFERILRVIVYEQPRYFSYKAQSAE